MMQIEEIKKYLTEDENNLLRAYQKMTDEELLDVICKMAEKMGRIPRKQDVELSWYFKNRFGPWPRMLEAAGLKPVSETYQRRKASNKRKQKTTRAHAAEIRRKQNEE